MSSYLVTWEIDIESDSPEQAAKEALEIQRGTYSEATYFTVKSSSGEPVDVHVTQEEVV